MKICVVGVNSEAEECCRTVIKDLPSGEWELIASPTRANLPRAEAYIWDLPSSELPADIDERLVAQSLFCIEAQDLGTLRRTLRSAQANIVLKPFRASTFMPFLSHVSRRNNSKSQNPSSTKEGVSGSAGQLDFLECLLHAESRIQELGQLQMGLLMQMVGDFSAPLRLLSGYSGMLLDQEIGPLNTLQAELVSKVHQSAAKSLERAERIATILQPHTAGSWSASIQGVVEQAIQEVAGISEKKNLRIKLQMDQPQSVLEFNAAGICHVVSELLNESCRSSLASGSIDVTGYSVGNPIQNSQRAAPLKKGTVPRGDTGGYRVDFRAARSIPLGLSAVRRDDGPERVALYLSRTIIEAHRGAFWHEADEATLQFSLVLPYRETRANGNKLTSARSA